MDTESIKLAPLKKTSLPQHFPQKGFSSKIFTNDHEEPTTSTTTTRTTTNYTFQMNRIVSKHRPYIAYYYDGTYNNALIIEQYVQRIVDNLEQDQNLLEDTPVSKLLREETLRELPQSLTIKRRVKAKLSKSINLTTNHKPISFGQELGINFNKVNDNYRRLKLWSTKT